MRAIICNCLVTLQPWIRLRLCSITISSINLTSVLFTLGQLLEPTRSYVTRLGRVHLVDLLAANRTHADRAPYCLSWPEPHHILMECTVCSPPIPLVKLYHCQEL